MALAVPQKVENGQSASEGEESAILFMSVRYGGGKLNRDNHIEACQAGGSSSSMDGEFLLTSLCSIQTLSPGLTREVMLKKQQNKSHPTPSKFWC